MVAKSGRLHPSTVTARKSDRHEPHLLGLGEGRDQVRRIAARRNTDQAVTRLAVSDDLADEDVLEADIIADGGDHREIGHQVRRRKRRAASRYRMHELDRDMRSIAARASVSHGKQLAAAPVDIG